MTTSLITLDDHKLTHTLSLSHTFSLSFTHTHTLSLSFTQICTHTLSLSLFHIHTHLLSPSFAHTIPPFLCISQTHTRITRTYTLQMQYECRNICPLPKCSFHSLSLSLLFSTGKNVKYSYATSNAFLQ